MESIVDTSGSVILTVGFINPQLLLIKMQMTTSGSVTSSHLPNFHLFLTATDSPKTSQDFQKCS